MYTHRCPKNTVHILLDAQNPTPVTKKITPNKKLTTVPKVVVDFGGSRFQKTP